MEIQRKTEHYSFTMELTTRYYMKDNSPLSFHINVGNPINPCLSISISSKESATLFGDAHIQTANINNIKNLKECILEEEKDDTKYSFTKEMLVSVMEYIRDTYPYILRCKLIDKSYIPCDENDTVDLLTYSIALYGTTWYESTFNAYIKSPIYDVYRKEVDIYSSPETKEEYTWDIFTLKYLQSSSTWTHDKFIENNEEYKELYTTSNTFPIFFKRLSETIPRKDKCKFFKYWLEEFINERIHIVREWFFDMQQFSKNSLRKKSIS
jgi:hypothetical protein